MHTQMWKLIHMLTAICKHVPPLVATLHLRTMRMTPTQQHLNLLAASYTHSKEIVIAKISAMKHKSVEEVENLPKNDPLQLTSRFTDHWLVSKAQIMQTRKLPLWLVDLDGPMDLTMLEAAAITIVMAMGQ